MFALCAGGAACAEPTIVEDYEKKGYTISVTYDANGGLFFNRPGGAIMDMFNPSEYEADSDGVTRIKLMEPTDPSRPTATSDKITLTMQNHFFAGWYKNRTVKLVDGKPVELCCAIGDKAIDGKPYYEIVNIARNYIQSVGGFERFAEWGLV